MVVVFVSEADHLHNQQRMHSQAPPQIRDVPQLVWYFRYWNFCYWYVLDRKSMEKGKYQDCTLYSGKAPIDVLKFTLNLPN